MKSSVDLRDLCGPFRLKRITSGSPKKAKAASSSVELNGRNVRRGVLRGCILKGSAGSGDPNVAKVGGNETFGRQDRVDHGGGLGDWPDHGADACRGRRKCCCHGYQSGRCEEPSPKPSVKAMALAHDVTDEAAWVSALDQAVARFGGLHILVNCAGDSHDRLRRGHLPG